MYSVNTSQPTVDAGLLVAPVDQQVSGAFWEPRQGQELDEAGNGITGKKVLPTRLAAQDLSMNTSASVRVLLLMSWKILLHTCFISHLSPTTWPSITPKAANTAEDKETAPRKCFGALSPKYIGCTFMLIPTKQRYISQYIISEYVIKGVSNYYSTRSQNQTEYLTTCRTDQS